MHSEVALNQQIALYRFYRKFPNVHLGGPGPARRSIGVVVGHPSSPSGTADLLGSVKDVGLVHYQLLRLLVCLEKKLTIVRRLNFDHL